MKNAADCKSSPAQAQAALRFENFDSMLFDVKCLRCCECNVQWVLKTRYSLLVLQC